MALKSILFCICKLQLHPHPRLPTRHTHTPNNMSSCEESHGEHLVVHSHLDYLLAFSSSLENTDGALTICLACLVLAQWDLENHVGM